MTGNFGRVTGRYLRRDAGPLPPEAPRRRRHDGWLVTGLVTMWVGLVSQTALAATVETESGLVQGVADSSVTVFRGLPFAAAPVGRLR